MEIVLINKTIVKEKFNVTRLEVYVNRKKKLS
jgi:hypothetical protein